MENSYNWIMSCINGSTNRFQFSCCYTLIVLFQNMYKDEPLIKDAEKELRDLLYYQEIKHSVEV